VTKATFRTPDDLLRARGEQIAESGWHAVTQERVDAFARLTHDAQWIHVDVERAQRESPFGGTVAHGFLTLSLLSAMAGECIALPPAKLAVNYGFDRVRFVAPVPVGAEVRARFAVEDAQLVEGGMQITWGVEMEIRDHPKPALAALWLARLFF
jgi:acyl dehydratase